MGDEDVYFKIYGNPIILGQSTNSGGDRDGREEKSRTVKVSVSVGDTMSFTFNTLDSVANNGLQGTFQLFARSGIEFYDIEEDEVITSFKLPKEPTVQNEFDEPLGYYENKILLVRDTEGSSNFLPVEVTIQFKGTVEILNAGYDFYTYDQCCDCALLPHIDYRGCTVYCECPLPAQCDNDVECDCNSFCDSSAPIWQNDAYTNGEGECTQGCETNDDCCTDDENDFRCVDGECQIATECPCPEGQRCVDKKCEDDPDDPDDPDGRDCGDDRPCPTGFECINGECVETDDPDPPSIGQVYMMVQKVRVELNKVKYGWDQIGQVASEVFYKNFTDQTIVFRRYRTVDVDEGCTNFNGYEYSEYGKQIGNKGPCTIDNNSDDGEPRNGDGSFTRAYVQLEGTNYNPPDDLIYDQGIFDTPYRSARLRTIMKTAILQSSFDNYKGFPKNGVLKTITFNEDGSRSTDVKRGQNVNSDAGSSYGTNGFIEKIQYYFVKVIETSTASSPSFVTTEERGEDIEISRTTQTDQITVSEKDTYVDGRTSNENFISTTPSDTTIPWSSVPYDTRIVDVNGVSPNGTKYPIQIQQKIVVTNVYTTSLYDDATDVYISGPGIIATFETPDAIFDQNPPDVEGYCETYEDCNSGQDCRNNKCVATLTQPCSNNSECPEGQSCDNDGKCRGSLDIDCGDDPSLCPAGSQCVDGKCNTSDPDGPDGPDGPDKPPPVEPPDDPDDPDDPRNCDGPCPDGQICVDGKCVDDCPEAQPPIPNSVIVIQ